MEVLIWSFRWKCWSSQPMYNGMRVGNMLLSLCLLLSGNSYTKIALLFKFVNLKFISKTLFYQHQSLYIALAVQKYWDAMHTNLLEERKNKDILLSSDARNNSPDHCAQCCTYTLADMVDEVILQQNIIDVREVEGRKTQTWSVWVSRRVWIPFWALIWSSKKLLLMGILE